MSNHVAAQRGATVEELRTFVARFFEMANDHDFDRMVEFLHDEVLVNGTPVPRDAVIAQFHAYAAAVPDLTWQVQDLVVEGDRVAVRLLDTGTPVTEWIGLAPTGASVSFTEVAFYAVRDLRLVSMTFLVDVDTARRQLAG